MPVYEFLGNGATEAFEITHEPPRFIAGSGKEFRYFFFVISQSFERVLPNGVLAVDSHEREVDTLQGHAVYFFFPFFPPPKSHRVAICAIIQIIPQGLRGFDMNRFTDCGQCVGYGSQIIATPRNRGMAIVAQVVV